MEKFVLSRHDELEMGYRTSIIKTAGYLVLSAVISLEEGDGEAISDPYQRTQ